MPKARVAAAAFVMLASSCAPARPPSAGTDDTTAAPNTLTEAERAAGWDLLFDGRSLDGWRGFRQATAPDGWRVEHGWLVRGDRGGDLITTEQFTSFELRLEWMVRPGGNSGIFFRVTETPRRLWETAPEMQVLDDARHADGRSRLTAAGANYALHPVPEGVVRPADEWNAVRLVVRGNHVEHWLNGVKVVEYEIGSADWARRVAESKFAEYPAYGLAERGHIGLQDHGDWVAFRNIKIRRLP